jgi:hypothetical protein
MTDFQYTLYRVTHDKVESKFEPIFVEIRNQINIYNRQFDLTINSYLKEWKEEIKKIEDSYKEHLTKANQDYENIIKEEGDDGFNNQHAWEQSGLGYLQDQIDSSKEEIKDEYKGFLDLYSKSILIALYSLNESTLNEITNTASDIFNKKIKPSHFNSRDYLNSAFQYLELVIELEMQKMEEYISKLKDIQFIRNNIVHSASVFSDIKIISQIVKKHRDVFHFDEEKGYLKIISSKIIKELFALLREFYEELLWAIDLKQDLLIIQNGFRHWLGIIDSNISIEKFKFNRPSKNKISIYFQAIPKDEDISHFECKISLKKSSKSSIEIINQINNKKINDFFEYEKKSKGRYLLDIFSPFLIDNNVFEIKILIY